MSLFLDINCIYKIASKRYDFSQGFLQISRLFKKLLRNLKVSHPPNLEGLFLEDVFCVDTYINFASISFLINFMIII